MQSLYIHCKTDLCQPDQIFVNPLYNWLMSGWLDGCTSIVKPAYWSRSYDWWHRSLSNDLGAFLTPKCGNGWYGGVTDLPHSSLNTAPIPMDVGAIDSHFYTLSYGAMVGMIDGLMGQLCSEYSSRPLARGTSCSALGYPGNLCLWAGGHHIEIPKGYWTHFCSVWYMQNWWRYDVFHFRKK